MIEFQRPLFLLITVLGAPGIYFLLKGGNTRSRIVGASRFLMIVLLGLAAAGPQVTVQEERMKQPTLTVLTDESGSAQLIQRQQLSLKDVQVRRKVIARGNSSSLVDGFIRNMEAGQAYLAVSDFQGREMERVVEQAQKLNASISAVRYPVKREYAVRVEGPGKTVPGAQNRFTVQVSSTENLSAPRMKVYMDSEIIYSGRNSSFSFTRTFDEKGYHRIRAELRVNDSYDSNDRYYRVVEVTRKPEVLVVGPRGSLGDRLSDYYSVSYSGNVPENLSKYYAVVLKKRARDSLTSYVSRGNGVVYTGDYDHPMDVLPVVRQEDAGERKDTRIVLTLTKSNPEGDNMKKVKRLAILLVKNLPGNVKLGIQAYTPVARDADVIRISKPVTLAYNREELVSKIKRLKASRISTGQSYHGVALAAAKKMAGGKGNIIMISDGDLPQGGEYTRDPEKVRQKALSEARTMEPRLIVIGVGGHRNEEFLKEIARKAGGEYRDADIADTVPFMFDAGGGAGGIAEVVNVNPDHFITRGLPLDANPALIDQVRPRRGAEMLVSSRRGDPILTAWRYGLGRVAAYSADTRDLSAIMSQDPVLGIRSVTWAVGDPQRKEKRNLEIHVTREGPVARANYRVEGMKREGEGLYTRELSVNGTGFHSFRGVPYATNYDREVRKVGYSDRMREIVRATGGKVYGPEQTGAIVEDLREFSSKKVLRKRNAGVYLLAVALLIFLSEVGYRKLRGWK